MYHLDLKFRQRVGNQFHYWGYLLDNAFVSPFTNQEPKSIHDRYIRINDVDGKEIYENDIVEAVTTEHPIEKVKGSIFYEDGEYLIDRDNNPSCSLAVVDIYRLKIVGNVYEGEA